MKNQGGLMAARHRNNTTFSSKHLQEEMDLETLASPKV